MFITLEGPEGSGKTSQMPLLAEYLSQQGYSVLTTREPGGTQISNQVRQVLMSMENKAMYPRTEVLLFLSARAQLVEEVIRPHLLAGDVILSDRYGDSTLAYQGYGHGMELDTLRRLLDFTTGRLYPDLTLLLDVDVETGLHRRRSSGGEWNRLDDYAVEFHQRVRNGYLELARQEPQRWVWVDANRSTEQVQADLRHIVLERLTTFK